MRILTADVGGTNTRVAVCSGATLMPEAVRRYRNAEHDGLSAVLELYLQDTGAGHCEAACVAVAGPVRGGRARLTNLDWEIDPIRLCAASGADRAFVINDLEAQGHALAHVQTARLHGTGPAPDTERRLVVGLGTGFNAAPVHRTAAGGVLVAVSECGHVSLPVWDEQSFALARHLQEGHGFASVEEVLSGRGLLALHGFCAGPHAASTAVELMTRLADPGNDPDDRRTADLFCAVLGRVLGDLALIHLPWGGLYMIGGLARAVAPLLKRHGFSENFSEKGRFSGFMKDFSVFIVEDDYSGLTGCADYARAAMR